MFCPYQVSFRGFSSGFRERRGFAMGFLQGCVNSKDFWQDFLQEFFVRGVPLGESLPNVLAVLIYLEVHG